MESTEERKVISEHLVMRALALEQWLQQACCLVDYSLQAMPGDASFRRYFRVRTPYATYVAMDAEPPRENPRPFIAIAAALRAMGLTPPDIIHADVAQGFLLLSDFGNATYLKMLTDSNAGQLYGAALDALAVLQSCRNVADWPLPLFTRELMWQEWSGYKDWFLHQLLGLPSVQDTAAVNECYSLIVESAAAQPQVFMYRDFHSANLMVLPDNGLTLLPAHVGLLDFQDAFIGPVTYDVVSLLRDCYVQWPDERVVEWALYYLRILQAQGVLQDIQPAIYLRWFDWMGIQRHLKALFTFARKHVRDQQAQYLRHVPRTLSYLWQVSGRYPELQALHVDIEQRVQPAFNLFMEAVGI